ncbi:MAG: hypothetical protein OEZ68_19060 [Gammaproteobacteria bacterium]|nr:hypothetical protein [Gammaproteobacteria bacterium]MDH5802908.1 hypothetical protein [Gammaproteobacteria bacterium]
MKKFAAKKLMVLIPASTLFLTGCLEEVTSELFRIDANNAQDVIKAALDAKDAISHAFDAAEVMLNDTTTYPSGTSYTNITYNVSCNDPALNATTIPSNGDLTIGGNYSPSGTSNLTLSFNNCVIQNSTLNGSLSMSHIENAGGVADYDESSLSGSLSADVTSDSGTLSLNLSNIVYDYTRNKANANGAISTPATEPYTEFFQLSLSVPLMGSLSIDTPVILEGDKKDTASNKPSIGQMTVTAGGNTGAQLDANNGVATSYDVAADTDGDGVYETAVNTVNW